MDIIIARRFAVHWKRLLVLSFSVLVLAGCSQEPEAAATPAPLLSPAQSAKELPPPATPIWAAEPAQSPEGAPAASSPPTTPSAGEKPAQPPATPTVIDTPAPQPVADTPLSASEPVFLLYSPANNTTSEVGVVRVQGRATAGATVTINGSSVDAASDGSFQYGLPLDEGANAIAIAVTGEDGQTQSRTVQVSFVPSEFALPFSLFYPLDGTEINEPTIQILGVTRPDAVVAINGYPVEAGPSGIFAGNLALEEGANLVEVVATDIDGNVRSEVIAVFYIP